MMPDPPRADLQPEDRNRMHHADIAAYGAMYRAGGATTGSGCVTVDGALAMWNPGDESAAYNCLIAFEAAPDPDRAWEAGEAAARTGGARVFGVGITHERRNWATLNRLAALGLTHEYEEFVWARRLGGAEALPAVPGAVALQTGDIDPVRFARVLNRGWELPENHGRGFLYAATIGLPGWIHYLALVNGALAGGATLFMHEGVALCMVAATDPAYRGRGVQTAFIAQRLADAAAGGCSLAATETVQENASPRNFQRAGFRFVLRRDMYRTELH